MNTDFVANAFDDAIALQKIRAYCETRIQELDFFSYERQSLFKILDILNGEDE